MKRGFTLKRSVNKGFTLIELMIVLGLTLLMTGIILPSFVRGNRLQKVVAARDKVKQAYTQARDNALGGKNGCPVGVAFLGWRVIVSGTTITMEGVCGNGNYPTISSHFSTKTDHVLGTTVNFTNLAVPANGVLFRPGGQGIYPPLSAASNIITITVADAYLNSRSFTINGFGNIQ